MIEVQVDAAMAVRTADPYAIGVLADDVAGEHCNPLLAINQLLRRRWCFWQLNGMALIGEIHLQLELVEANANIHR